ncbi:hypothetical protein FJY63_14415, partial [Candidatus Sumerlaeota bacterium]|nr:hypothetical protein [Candidatus Sumerlaeota bacterium]
MRTRAIRLANWLSDHQHCTMLRRNMWNETNIVEITKTTRPGMCIITLRRSDSCELFVTARPLAGEPIEALFDRASQPIRECNGRVVNQDVFHIGRHHEAAESHLRDCLGPIAWPITWLEDDNGERPLAGTFIHAVAGTGVEVIALRNRIVGCVWEDEYARYATVADLRDEDISRPKPQQARRVFADMVGALRQVGMDFSHVGRTWLYNNDILSWYDEFNHVRTSFFRENGVFDGVVPASTGIGGRNPFGAALMGAFVAVKPKSAGVSVNAVPSPLQCSAREYGSSFSRAVEFVTPDHRRLWVSGTASIDPQGATAHVGDARGQIEWTMRVVEAILKSRGMNWDDVVRAAAYIRHYKDAAVFEDYCQTAGFPPLPVVLTNNTVCREELLFEIE